MVSSNAGVVLDVVKKELRWKAKLLVYLLIFVPTFTYGHMLWTVTDNLCRVLDLSKERSDIRRKRGEEPLLLPDEGK